MVREGQCMDLHVCTCFDCREHPRGAVAREHQLLNRLLAAADERLRRLVAGFFARQRGRGGIVQVAQISGLDRNTVARGRRELSRGTSLRSARIRTPGAGRRKLDEKCPGW